MALPVSGALALVILAPGPGVDAADHLDPPARTDRNVTNTPDVPADIADVFAWHTQDRVNFAVTFAGPAAGSMPAFYDRDLLYKILISTQPPNDTPDITIKARFGRGIGPNQFGVRFEGLPGVDGGVIAGPVATILEKDGVQAIAGLFDDPFYFDLVGFRETRSTGKIRFTNQRDFFAGQNDTAIVLSFPKDRFTSAAMPIGVWATTSRIAGQP